MSEHTPEAPTGEGDRFAAYDTTYEKFLPGTFTSKSATSKAAKALQEDGSAGLVGDVEIRKV